ncbi:threonine/serine exporter family protein [Thermodesulfobium narugense]|nr:threonine/serine exporter family protein [Thermodesulfobium narugense]
MNSKKVLFPGKNSPEVKFIVELGKAFHKCGFSSYALEERLMEVASKFNIALQVYSSPTGIFLSFEDQDAFTTTILRVEPGILDLEKIALTNEISNRVLENKITAKEGVDLLKRVMSKDNRFSFWIIVFSYAAVSAMVSIIMGGGLKELFVSSFLGLITGIIFIITNKLNLTRLLEFICAASVGALSNILYTTIGPYDQSVSIISGLIVLFPGLTLISGIDEIANRNLVSGTTRLSSAIFILMFIVFGVALGTDLFFPHENSYILNIKNLTFPLPFKYIATLLAPLTFIAILNARTKDAPVMLVSSLLAQIGLYFGNRIISDQIGIFFASLVLGSFSNSWARFSKGSQYIPLISGLILLVPGVVGYQSLSSFLSKDINEGIMAAFNMSLRAIALVTGLLCSNFMISAYKPKKQD